MRFLRAVHNVFELDGKIVNFKLEMEDEPVRSGEEYNLRLYLVSVLESPRLWFPIFS